MYHTATLSLIAYVTSPHHQHLKLLSNVLTKTAKFRFTLTPETHIVCAGLQHKPNSTKHPLIHLVFSDVTFMLIFNNSIGDLNNAILVTYM